MKMNESKVKQDINSRVIRSGWISKKVAHSFPNGVYRRRFLVLSSDRLCYFHSQPNESLNSKQHVAPELILPLHEASEIVFLKSDDPTIGYFEVVTPSRRYRFKTSVDDAELWVRDINLAKTNPQGSNTRPLLYLETSKSAVPKTSSTIGGFMKSVSHLLGGAAAAQVVDDGLFTIDQANALQR